MTMSESTDNQTTALVRLDDSTNDSANNNNNDQVQLRLIDSNFQMFKSKPECVEYIESQPATVHISLIVTGRLGQEMVPDIHKLPQVAAIYVFCMNREVHEAWAKNYEKVKGVVTDFVELQNKLRSNYTSTNDSANVETSTNDTPETAPAVTGGISVTYELDGVYMISDSCFDYVIRMKTLPDEKDDFPTLCQSALQGNDRLLAIIQEFKQDYSADRAIHWLNRDPFFHGYIDLIFKTATVDAIFPCRVFLQDIIKQLEQNKCTSTVEVYRAELIPDEKFQNLISFNGKILAIKEFSLGNLNRDKALSYTAEYSSCDEYKRVLFTIEANPEIENAKPFAKIGSIGYENDVDDVLFMIGSLFEITEIQDEKDGIINIKMKLCANNDTNTAKQLCDEIKNRYIDENGQTDLLGFGRFLIDLGNSINDRALTGAGEKFIHSFLEKLSEDHPDRPRCYDALGNSESLKNDLDSSLEWYNKSLYTKKQYGTDDLSVAESYLNLAVGYAKKGNSTQALNYFNELLMIWKSHYGDDYYNLIFCYTQMAIIHENKEDIKEAIACYYRALAVMLKHETVQEVSYATLYNNLGNAYTGLKYYQLALGYHNTSLEIKKRMYTTMNPSIAATYKNIGVVHQCMNNIPQSRENLEKAADIYRQLSSADDANVTEIEELIRNLLNTDQN